MGRCDNSQAHHFLILETEVGLMDSQDGAPGLDTSIMLHGCSSRLHTSTTSRDNINLKNEWRLFPLWGNRGPIGSLWTYGGTPLGSQILQRFWSKWAFIIFQTHFPANYDLADISRERTKLLCCLFFDFGPFSASEFSWLSALFYGPETRLDLGGQSQTRPGPAPRFNAFS